MSVQKTKKRAALSVHLDISQQKLHVHQNGVMQQDLTNSHICLYDWYPRAKHIKTPHWTCLKVVRAKINNCISHVLLLL